MKHMWVRLSIIHTGITFIVATLLVGIIALFQPDAPRIASQVDLSQADREALVQLIESGVFEEALRTAVFSQILGLFVLAILAGVIASAWSSWIITRPLSVLDDAIHSVSKRDFSEKVDIQGPHEVESLADSFNLMVSELASAEKQRQSLLADVAHELRTPLSVLQGNLRGMLDDIYKVDQERVATLYNQVLQLNHLVDDLHDLAQAEANQLRLQMMGLHFDKLVIQAIEIFTPLAAESNIHLSANIEDSVPVIRGDKKRLMQVLQNLLVNGIRYAQSAIVVRLQVGEENIVLSISDDGPGISADKLAHIFDRFYRVDSSRNRSSGGSGLGLAIVRSILQAHKGTIDVQSTEGAGTIFVLQIPISYVESR